MKLDELDFYLPPERIAQEPAAERDAARLLVVDRAQQSLADRTVRDLPAFLRNGDCLVLNQTRVLPARFEARRKSGGRVPGLFLGELAPSDWQVLLESRGRLSEGDPLELANAQGLMHLQHRGERGAWRVRIDPPRPAAVVLQAIGSTPLPPYIRRDAGDARDAMDQQRYQTVYAAESGSIAAPTAGLHFTPELLRRIEALGVVIARVTLHVGLGTFQPVLADDLDDHPMHAEWCDVSDAAAETINAARRRGGRVIAVGTTSTRVLETRVDAGGIVQAGAQWTRLLIQPPYQFRVVDALMTNFHLPRSTLLALIYAFVGMELGRCAYQHAITNSYRFYSFGDAMLVV